MDKAFPLSFAVSACGAVHDRHRFHPFLPPCLISILESCHTRGLHFMAKTFLIMLRLSSSSFETTGQCDRFTGAFLL